MDPNRNHDGGLASDKAFSASHTKISTLADNISDLSKCVSVKSRSKCKRTCNVREKESTHCTIYGP